VPNARWHVIKDTDLTYLLVGALNEERYYAKAVTDISRGEAGLSAFLAERHPLRIGYSCETSAERRYVNGRT